MVCRGERQLIACFVPALLVLSATSGATEPSLDEALKRHTAGRKSITSYHLRISSRSETIGQSEGTSALEPPSTIEIWRDGLRRREWRRDMAMATPQGLNISNDERGWVSDASEDPWQSRRLEGWDRDRPFPLPLEFGRDAAQFGKVKGYLLPPNTDGIDDGLEAFVLLWSVFPRTRAGLSELSTVAELDLVPAESPEQLRLLVRASSDPALQKYVGATIDLALQHGCQVCRIAFEDEHAWTVREATGFQEVVPGVWVSRGAKQSRRLKHKPLRQVSEWTIDACEINVPISAADLTVSFPRGARVDERVGERIHIWGESGPMATFTSHQAFRDYIYARAREYQSRNLPRSTAASSQGSRLVATLVVNGALVAALVGLTFLRRRLARRAAGAAKGAAPADPPSAANRA